MLLSPSGKEDLLILVTDIVNDKGSIALVSSKVLLLWDYFPVRRRMIISGYASEEEAELTASWLFENQLASTVAI